MSSYTEPKETIRVCYITGRYICILLGNENIRFLTLNRPSEVYFKLKRRTNGAWYHAKYSNFSIGPESGGYRLQLDVNSYTGNAGMHTIIHTNLYGFVKSNIQENLWGKVSILLSLSVLIIAGKIEQNKWISMKFCFYGFKMHFVISSIFQISKVSISKSII